MIKKAKILIPVLVGAVLSISLFYFLEVTGQTQVNAANEDPVLLLEVPGLGKVEADLVARELIITCYNPGRVPVEYSILAGNSYRQSEAGGWSKPEFRPAVKREPLPHYKTFIVTIVRYEKIGSVICRENDGKIGFIRLK